MRIAVTNYGGRTYNPYQNAIGNIVYSPDHLQVGVIDNFILPNGDIDFNGDGTIDRDGSIAIYIIYFYNSIY